jgi:hypothetical protein
MEKTNYNGWTNYATWRVNLEVFDSMTPEDFDLDEENIGSVDVYDFSQSMKDYISEMLEMGTPDGLAKDYAFAFLSDVNFYEIAEHFLDAHLSPTDEARANGGR